MRVVVLGATGNVGTSVLEALAGEPAVTSILGVARRVPSITFPKTDWAGADVCRSDLVSLFRGADVVIHLAWLIQPARHRDQTYAVNVEGSARVFAAVADAGVPALVYASSIGAYSPGPQDRRVDESWPTDGIPTSFYSRDKAAVERLLDRFEHEHEQIRVVRLRPGLIFKRDAATEIRRLFAGPLLPNALVRRSLWPILPLPPHFGLQLVHSLDVGEAYRLAAVADVRGAFNIAAEPVLDRSTLARELGARPVSVPAAAVRAAIAASFRLRLQPSEPGWLDLGLGVPRLDMTRARETLGWTARHRSTETLHELLAGLRDGADGPTPPLDKRTDGPLRIKEFGY